MRPGEDAGPAHKLSVLAREIDAFAGQVALAIAGLPVKRDGVVAENPIVTLDAWSVEIARQRRVVRMPLNGKPLKTYADARNDLLSWYDGVPRVHFRAGGSLQSSQAPTAALIIRKLHFLKSQFRPC